MTNEQKKAEVETRKIFDGKKRKIPKLLEEYTLEDMSYSEIESSVLSEISAATDYHDTRTSRRGEAWDRYYGEVIGNEVKGRSQFVTREVMDTIEWMMPYFIRTFGSGDPKVRLKIEGQPAIVGDALLKQIQLDLNNEGGSLFLLLYQWIKDCLVSDTSFVKIMWERDVKRVSVKFDQLSSENMQQLLDDPDSDIVDATEQKLPDGTTVFNNVRVSIKKYTRNDLAAYNCPHWEFMCDPRSRDMNDEYGKGHKTEVTLDFLRRINRSMKTEEGEEFFKNLDLVEFDLDEQSSTDDLSSLSTQASQYLGYDLSRSDQMAERKGPRATVTYVEWYTRLDVNNDGFLEDIVCYFANDRLIRAELNKDGIVPFSALRPIIDCYKFYGISYADLIIEIQNLKTMLFRRILDNFDYQNSGRWLVDPAAQVDTYELLRNRPGSVVFGRPDGITDLTPRPFNPGTLTILEYVDSIRENRTGITRYNQGTDASSLNRTATGIVQIQTAAMQRLELIARIFAETGLRDFYYKCAKLYQLYRARPFTVSIAGQEVTVTPDMLQGKIIAQVNMGVQASIGMQESQKLERLFAFLAALNQQVPGLLQPEQVYNLARHFTTMLGFQDYEEFLPDQQSFMQSLQTIMQQHQQQQQLMERQLAMQETSVAAKAQQGQQKVRVKALDTAAKRKLEQEQLRHQKEKDATDAQLKVIDLLAKTMGGKP